METQECVDFLFEISKQVKDCYESSVIFITQKDYNEILLSTLCDLQSALKKDDKDHLLELIVQFHLQWLHAVNEIEGFSKTVGILFTKEDMCQAISFTIDAYNSLAKRFQAFIDENRRSLGPDEQTYLNADFEIIEDMHTEVSQSLCEKINHIRQCEDEKELKIQISDATNELLYYFDSINDGLAVKLSKSINLKLPNLIMELTKTLQQGFHEYKSTNIEDVQKIFDELKLKGKDANSMIRYATSHNLEINKVADKIHILDDRIKRLEAIDRDKPSAVLLDLQHKRQYFEKRLNDIENLRTSLLSLEKITDISMEDDYNDDICSCKDFFQLRIFNHCLPIENRERLITEFCYLWDVAIFGERSNKSLISILSATEIKEEFTDEMGTFYIDEHSRKIYKLPNDDTRYQPNERHELVPVSDDADHVYSYDECGRYYMDAITRERVYKAHATASEYMMDSFGVLLKIKEERNGITYFYDNYGSYYINSEGKRIYRDPDRLSEYENDGLGNLVRIRSHLDIFEPCPDDAHVTEDFNYLKIVVGKALRTCLGQLLLLQPQDPIKYLSKCLIKYRENIELSDKRARESEELNVERERIAEEERAAAEKAAMEAALLMQGGSEASYDSNFLKYGSPDEAASLVHT